MPDVMVRRVMTPEEATTLVGEKILEPPIREPLPDPSDEVTRIIDEETSEIVGLVTRLDRGRVRALRSAVGALDYSMGVARKGMPVAPNGRTFGYVPKRPIVRQEACRSSTAARQNPDEHAVLTGLASYFTEQFKSLMPQRAADDDATLRAVLDEWRMEPGALWTSGVVNKTAQLPYHRDGANFHTWSVMPTLRLGVDGGGLYVPEYDLLFPCRDGEVSWFCGRDLVHGVTPIVKRRADGYRYSIVYYALAGMVDCRTYAEESANATVRRTAREREIAAAARERLGVESA